MQISRSGLAHESLQGSKTMIQNVNTYPYVYTPNLLRPVPKKKKVVKKVNKAVVSFMLLATMFTSSCVLPFSFKSFVKPVFASTAKDNLGVKIEKIYAPTSEYLHNNEFLGVSSFIGAETEKPLMKKMTLTDNMPVLESKIAALANEYQLIHPSVFAWDYETGKFVSYNSNEAFPAASIIKIPVLLELFRSIEAGQLSIDDQMTLTDYYRAEGSGDLQFQREGNLYSIDSLARKMIEISDNSSTNMLMSAMGGMNTVNRAIKSWGLKNTEINNWLPDMGGTNVTTTEDLARMLFNIENDQFLSAESKDKIFDYMGHVKNNRLLQAGISPNAKIYHKTGDIGHTLGDAGIVTTPDGHKYIICVMAKRPYNHPAGKDFTVRASQIIYDALSQRHLT